METNKISVAKPMVGEEEVNAVRDVLLSGSYVSGKHVKKFEKAFAEYIGTDYAVAVSNGTAALYIALESLEVGVGDEVIVPPLTFFATISSVLARGAIPVFADIDLDDLCISPESIKKKITSRTKAILPVHLFGSAAKMEQLCEISSKKGIPVLEDCAQAHGTLYKGKKVGSIGNAGAFSFFATKHMTTGEGGMITTNDDKLAEIARVIRNHGMDNRDDHILLGFNNRMTEIEAAMGLVQLNKLDDLNAKRIENSKYIIERIKHLSWVHIPTLKHDVEHTYFWCPLMVRQSTGKSLEKLKEHLSKNKIGFRYRYKEPLYRQPVLRRLRINCFDLKLPNVEKVAGNVIGLPNHPGLKKKELDRIIIVINEF